MLTNRIVRIILLYLANNALIISQFNAAPENEIRQSGTAIRLPYNCKG
jgi:hypothetical protein